MNEGNNNGPWWKPAVALFGDVSTWIIVPIILALVVGKWLDKHFGTDNLWFLICAGLGFLMTILGIVKVVGRYIKDIQKIENESRDKNIE